MAKEGQSTRQLKTVLLKPAGPDCNLACRYCFYLDKAHLFSRRTRHRMDEAILETTIRQAMTQAGGQISFVWQGGEPTLMGVSFYEKAVAYQQRYGHGRRVGNALQTNGLLLDRKWTRFLSQYRFLVGLSLDGPEHVHDHYRCSPTGRGSWHRTMDKADLLREAGVEVNALAVVTDYSARFPEELYAFFKQHGFQHLQFIPCVEPDPDDPRKPAAFAVRSQDYGEFLCRIFDLWLGDFVQDLPTTSVRYFDSLLYPYVGLAPPECSLLPVCGDYVVVEHNGDVYPCDFHVEPEWRLGRVQDASLSGLLSSDSQQAFGQRKAILPATCQHCQWLEQCQGGCPSHRLPRGDSAALNYLCPAFQRFFAHADPVMRRLAGQWRARQART